MPLTRAPYILWLEWQGFYADDALASPQVVVRDNGVLDANLAARRCGIEVGMTVWQARNVVPDLVQKPWREEDYLERGGAWLDLCLPFCDRIEPIDAHIAAMDLRGHSRPIHIAETLMESLVQAVGLPLRAGAGPSKWVATLAASCRDLRRAVENPASFLAPLPVERLSPLDPPVRERLAFLGHRTVGEVAALPLALLRGQFGDSAHRILQAAWGTLADPVVPGYPRDALRARLVFDSPPDTFQALDEGFSRLSNELAERLVRQNAVAKRIDLVLRHEEGESTAIGRTFARPLASARDLLGALRLMLPEPPARPIECLEVDLVEIKPARRVQLGLDARRAETEASLRACVGNIRTAFGERAIQTGTEIVPPRWQGVRRAYRDAYGWAWP